MQLIELEDLPWIPQVMRDGGRDLMDFLLRSFNFYGSCADKLEQIVLRTSATHLTDLFSGSGGRILAVREQLRNKGLNVKIVLTDLLPNPDCIARVKNLNDPLTYFRQESIEAMYVRTQGLVTMIGALHRFQPSAVEAFLTQLINNRVPFAICDIAASQFLRSLPLPLAIFALFAKAVFLFMLALLLAPLVCPIRPKTLFFCYAVPVIPLFFAWDGTVSAMRAYTPDELIAMAKSADKDSQYEFSCGRSGSLVYLSGKRSQGNTNSTLQRFDGHI